MKKIKRNNKVQTLDLNWKMKGDFFWKIIMKLTFIEISGAYA